MLIIIDIEGTDGSGKYTQSKMLCEHLIEKGINCKLHSFPSYESLSSGPVKMYLGGEFGDNANSLDAYQASSLYAVDRLCTVKKMQHDFEDGVLILDRYTPSNMMHQACKIKDKEERDKCLDWIENFEYECLKLPRPNIIFFLDMPIETSKQLANARTNLKAGTSQDLHEKDKEYLTNAYNTGIEVSKKYGWKQIHCLDKDKNVKTKEEIHYEIMKHVEQLLKQN